MARLQVPAVELGEGTGEAMETFPGLGATQVATESWYQRETFVQSSLVDSLCLKHFVKPSEGQILRCDCMAC